MGRSAGAAPYIYYITRVDMMAHGYRSSSRTKRKPGPKPKTTPAERRARALSLTGVRSVGRTRLVPLGDDPRLMGFKKLNAENPPGIILTIKEREELKKSILALMEVNNIAYTVAAKAVGISAATACLWRKADPGFLDATEAAHVATVGALVDAAQNLYARVLGDEEADTKDRLGVADKVLRSRAAAEHLLAPAVAKTAVDVSLKKDSDWLAAIRDVKIIDGGAVDVG